MRLIDSVSQWFLCISEGCALCGWAGFCTNGRSRGFQCGLIRSKAAMNLPTQVVVWTQARIFSGKRLALGRLALGRLSRGWLCGPTAARAVRAARCPRPGVVPPGRLRQGLCGLPSVPPPASGTQHLVLYFLTTVYRVKCWCKFHTHSQRFFKFKHLKFFIFQKQVLYQTCNLQIQVCGLSFYYLCSVFQKAAFNFGDV